MKITGKRIKIIVILLVAIAALSVFFIMGKKNKTEYTTVTVARGKLTQTVSEVGTVKSSQEIELSFLQSGKVGKISVQMGDKVKEGQVLAELDYNSFSIKEQEAQANLDVANANLNKLLAGATSKEIAVSQAQVDQAKATYLANLAELDKIEKTTAEDISQAEKSLADLESNQADDITSYEQAVTLAETDLANAKSTYEQSINNKRSVALTTVDNKLVIANTALDNINTILEDSDAEEPLKAKNRSYLPSTVSSYADGVELLTAANNSLATAKTAQTNSAVITASQNCLTALNKVFEALDYCYKALENSVVSSAFTQTELDVYKTSISTQITAISTAISAVQTAQHNLEDAVLTYQTEVTGAEDDLAKAKIDLANAIKSAKNSLASVRLAGDQKVAAAQSKVDTSLEAWQVAKAQLENLKSPARIQDVSLYRAQVKQAEAALALAKEQIGDSIIKAPIDGTVVRIEYELGEQATAAKPAIAILGENNFEIEVDISEADITKVKKDNPVEITLDAFGDGVKFFGKVYSIEPAETIIQDVTYYKVKIQFTEKDETKMAGIKSGMTANVIITTNFRDNVLIMPSRAVVEKNGGDKYARILVGQKAIEMPVKIGLQGDEGMVEVLSGVKEGDQAITFVKDGN
ncbi:MAG: efflux RND transporter periplasmic adaptor subunit [Patescibacteria group bacterium]|nr:efflux RND transporter periplasmic adaptor subunit [Patescibacteria group bacterium]MDD5294668.1 efflux RND transporter periplasmic adaptor subunit [Patescibacteria group bacterium]MDD5554583.1 efflux RND transporter periplasmic adaptor subunit [Patescibacteria group bacterium]